jgi:predicted enzyme related to lactoylglutathione lyase
MSWTLALVPVPVSDVDRALAFYTERVGFHLDHDALVGGSMRFVQLTPPGSTCSIVIGTDLVDSEPGSLTGLLLVVPDLDSARAELVERGVEVSEIERIGPEDGAAFVRFSDPDGNGWAVQEIRGEPRPDRGPVPAVREPDPTTVSAAW